MTQAHTAQIDLVATPYYHCVSRCVRRAFLCGDAYEHRREWVKEKLFELADIFCIEIAGYAVMSNHYHLVLFIDVERCESLSDREVIDRWHTIFKGNMLSQKMARGESISKAEANVLDEIVEEWRQRLMRISWFMRVLNEPIARMANAEDQCSGRLWEGRFKSQALL